MKRFPNLPDVVTGSLSGAAEGLHLRDSFSVTTRICSTKLTQDGIIIILILIIILDTNNDNNNNTNNDNNIRY